MIPLLKKLCAVVVSVAVITGLTCVPDSAYAAPVSFQTAKTLSVSRVVKAPTQVKAVTVTSLSAKSVLVKWKKTAQAKTYQVKIGSKTVKTSKTTVKVSGKANASVKVRAVGKSGKLGKWSTVRYVAPWKPSAPVISNSGVSRAAVSWKKVAGASKYEVQIGKRVTRTTKTSLSAGVRSDISVKVRAIGKKGQKSAWSIAVKRVPVVPSGLKVFADSTYWGALQWSAVPGATHYEVKVNNTISRAYDNYDSIFAEVGDQIFVRTVVGGRKSAWSAPVTKKLNADERTDLLSSRAQHERYRNQYLAWANEARSELSTLHYQLEVAKELGTPERVREVEAKIVSCRAEISGYENDAKEQQQEIDAINAKLKIGL